ncbi:MULTISPECIES: hypothetical protein [Sphingobium]|uniref:hypothetical protein n=1 Tax=Sphingobium TaxID=165695 RepID=UPI0015EB3DCD|nr:MULTISPECIES: hypothetical protein [Sphingobium]MCW2362425.1 hypothetical protein [Sphingobium sp. B10D3B]MCW2400896.1 hypothetical protein [Sphingobium sp. B10D7B]MCW2407875.1 hypothetical protein [Sphingobium xanthum]
MPAKTTPQPAAVQTRGPFVSFCLACARQENRPNEVLPDGWTFGDAGGVLCPDCAPRTIAIIPAAGEDDDLLAPSIEAREMASALNGDFTPPALAIEQNIHLQRQADGTYHVAVLVGGTFAPADVVRLARQLEVYAALAERPGTLGMAA